jgi:hypothetical protein
VSVIIGMRTKEGVYLAADTLVVHRGGQIKEGRLTKILRSDHFAVAVAGDMRAVTVLAGVIRRIGLRFQRDVAKGAEPGEWPLRDAINALRKALIDDGFGNRADKGECYAWAGQMLVATAYGVYALGNDFCPVAMGDWQPATYGAGEDLAKGAISVASTQGMNVRATLRCAISVAAQHCSQVGGDCTFLRFPAAEPGVTEPAPAEKIEFDTLLPLTAR